jgi:outer membrane protein assembly factor BamD (BamD/ComL family)
LETVLNRNITYEEAVNIFEENKKRYNYSNWNMFGVLYTLYYNQYKKDVIIFLKNLTDFCVESI